MKKPGQQQSPLKRLRTQQARLNAQIKRKNALLAQQGRKRDTRRKVLLGAVVLELMQQDEGLRTKVLAALQVKLQRRVDRAVFVGFSLMGDET